MTTVRRFVFVCSGNICRSPMAAAIARKRLEDAGVPAQVISMGTLGLFGHPADSLAVEVCADAGVDLSGHVSQGLSLGLLRQADAVLVMEHAHLDDLAARFGEVDRVRLLSEFDREAGPPDIADPIGGDRVDFEACFQRLDEAVAGLVEQVRRGLL